jgi:hypothetical protein
LSNSITFETQTLFGLLGLNFTLTALKGQITTTQGNALSENARASNAL